MAPIFTVFKNEFSKTIIETLDKNGYTSFVDSVNTTPQMIKSKYLNSNIKFFGIDYEKSNECWYMYDEKSLDDFKTNFCLSFDITVPISDRDWRLIFKWLRLILSGGEDELLTREISELLPPVNPLPEKVSILKTQEPVKPQNEGYDFQFIQDDMDRCIIQIDKPFTDRPYTVVIRQFSQRGFLPFFTALFVCKSWGVASADHAFLEKIWSYLGMEQDHGKLDLENRLKNDIEACIPKPGYIPNAEPEVYRLSIDQVKELWSNKRKPED